MEYINLIGQTPQIQIFIICFFGIFMGSLLNVINNRVPNMLAYQNALLVKDNAIEVEKEVEEVLSKYKDYNLFFPSSHCPKCKKKIHWYENIPVLSWLFLRGKCSNCKVFISPEYPIVELLNLGLWYGAYVYFGWTTELFFVIAALTMILSITVIDLKYQILPDTAMFLLFLIPLYLSIVGLHNIEASTIIITSVLVYFGLLFFFSSYESFRGFEEHILGRGDIKYFAVISAWVGGIGLLHVVMYSVFFGLLSYLIIYLFFNKDNILDRITPFGPSISLAFILIYFNILPIFISI